MNKDDNKLMRIFTIVTIHSRAQIKRCMFEPPPNICYTRYQFNQRPVGIVFPIALLCTGGDMHAVCRQDQPFWS